MHQDQGAALSRSDQVGAKDGFPETGWSHDNAVVVFKYDFHYLVLGIGQFTEKEPDMCAIPGT